MSQAVFDYDEDVRTLRDYLAILKRRKLQLAVPAVVGAAIALAVTFALPAKYTSQATILIEDQEVPREFVTSTITTFAAQQVQVISQRVLTTERIAGIAERFNLYTDPDTGTRPPATRMAEDFRRSMKVDLVSADVIDPRSGRPQQATIAFTMTFEYGDPSIAQRVTNELVTLFLDENLRTRAERAASTGAFLTAEAESLNQELLGIERQIASFKEQNEGAMPGLYQFNLGLLDRTSREILDIDMRLSQLEQRKLEISSQLAQLEPWQPVISRDGMTMPSEQGRLRALRAEFRQKQAVYRPNHPDLQRLSREIADLEAVLGTGETREELQDALQRQRAELTDLRQRFQDDSVQVVAARRQVEDLERRLAALPQDGSTTPAPDNPAYVLLDTQLKAATAEEGALRTTRVELTNRRQQLEAQITRAPSVEQAYQALLRDYESAQVKFREIRYKQREAELAESLETERKGERFSLVEPPTLPLEPSSPNRPAVLMLGMLLAVGAGVGLMLLLELMDSAIHGEKRLAQLTGAPPFAVVSYIENSDDRAAKKRVWQWLLLSAGAGMTVLLVFVHVFVRPLDMAWFIVLARLGM
jgi:succinoglycan biosynthesis transport protein ExoP